MRSLTHLFLGLPSALALPSLANYATNSNTSGLLVNTTSGFVQGFINTTAPDVRQWLGVPFAKPPVGKLRFAAPEPAEYNSTVLNANKFPDSCMQQYSNGSTIYTAYARQFLINGGQSEDCLYVSIWAPSIKSVETTQVPLPVFVYIPGGGFTSGGQDSLAKLPDQWIQRTQSHVVVIMNYRVNLFGFPNTPALDAQNLGLRDQRLVVEWVQQNIAGFGGDPTRVVLWGQSAGAASVAMFPYAWHEDPIVTGLIADSGALSIARNADIATGSNFTFLAGLVGCGNSDQSALLECMRERPAQELEDALSQYQISKKTPPLAFGPGVDNVIVFSNATQRLLDGKLAKIPAIYGNNENEGAGFVPFTPSGPGAAVLLNTTLQIIACPVNADIAARNLRPDAYPTYRYLYTGNFTNVSPLPWFGAYHSAELPLLFGTHDQFNGPSSPFEYDVSHAMQALWLSFAENPAAGAKRFDSSDGGYFSWPRFENKGGDLVIFARDGEAVRLGSAGEELFKQCPK